MGKKCRGPDEPRRFHVEDAATYCAICGQPLLTWQIAAVIDGDATDFNNRSMCSLTLTVCDECWSIMMQNIDGGLTEAINRYIERTKDGD